MPRRSGSEASASSHLGAAARRDRQQCRWPFEASTLRDTEQWCCVQNNAGCSNGLDVSAWRGSGQL
jgi:hypothetical protein